MGWLLAILDDALLRVPTRFELERVGGYLDGGTTDIIGRDESGRRRRVRLTQRMFERRSWFAPPVGRLYLGWRRIPMRGPAEAAVLALVERLLAEPVAGPDADERPALDTLSVASLRWVLEYARSDSYGEVE